MKYLISIILALLWGAATAIGMEYGMRFNSHSHPANQRTSLKLSETPFKFADELSVGFDMCFYEKDRFGIICTLKGNDDTIISLVSSPTPDGYAPAIVINNELHQIPVDFIASQESPVRPIIILKRHENKVVFVYDKVRYSFPVTLSDMTSASISFGKLDNQESVAPIEIQDVRVYTEKKNTHKWELRIHDGDTTLDELSQTTAVAINPHWILDDHVIWSKIYTLSSTEKVQTAFNPINNKFYIASESAVSIFDPISNKVESIPVEHDGRMMKYSNYLTFDTLTNQLLSYNFEDKKVARFDFASKTWNSEGSDSEPRFANHAFATDNTYAYMFGGYGFYLYHNNLFRLNLRDDKFEEFTLKPLPDPRTSTAMCVSGNSLYIFGGKGNAIGKQEIPSKEYYDLWEYDLSTFCGRKVWELDSVNHNFLPSSMMYYVAKDSAFYAAATLYGGSMIKISANRPEFKAVSEPIHEKMDFRDCVFNLYRSLDEKVYYLVIDKRLNDFSHSYNIYQICYPFGDELLYDNFIPKRDSDTSLWRYLWIAICCLIAGSVVIIIYKRRSKLTKETGNSDSNINQQDNHCPNNDSVKNTPVAEPQSMLIESDSCTDTESEDSLEPDDTKSGSGYMDSESDKIESAHMGNQDAPKDIEPSPVLDNDANPDLIIAGTSASASSLFDSAKSSISFLGNFEVRDKNGEDITSKFTSRIKDLLIILILNNDKDEKGISFQKIDDEIWGDKDEKSAKNNRNVYMRKLRLLLEEIGDMGIDYEKGYYRISYNNVFVDYHEAITRLNRKEITGTTLDETSELLLLGPLLPNIEYPWLDTFKSEFTNQALSVLHKLLDIEQSRKNVNEELTYKIAETISRHDALSEEALSTMCRILYNRHMKGPAKNLYDNFCKEYKKCFNEDYHIPFPQIFKA